MIAKFQVRLRDHKPCHRHAMDNHEKMYKSSSSVSTFILLLRLHNSSSLPPTILDKIKKADPLDRVQ